MDCSSAISLKKNVKVTCYTCCVNKSFAMPDSKNGKKTRRLGATVKPALVLNCQFSNVDGYLSWTLSLHKSRQKNIPKWNSLKFPVLILFI